MRLFLYYALHTVKNQLRKLFKTWILVFFLICLLLGGLIGFGAASLSDLSEQVQVGQELSGQLPTEAEEEALPSLTERLGIEGTELAELAAGLVILLVFFFYAFHADQNGSRIFLPADVNLLFSSPMRPQSVLMFRLTTQLGMGLVGSLFLLFQLPNLTLNAGLSLWAALLFIAVWCFAIVVGTLFRMLLYLLCAESARFRANLRRGLLLFLLLLLAAFLLFWQSGGLSPLPAAARFFNAPWTRFIPFWGWLKAVCVLGMEGHFLPALLCLLAAAAGGAALALLIWRRKVDFYEDAMAKTEETAALLARAETENRGAVAFILRKKDRSERLRRDGLRRGKGAGVFFFKALYNRFRFAHLGFFTKTMESYLAAAAAVSLLCRYVFHTELGLFFVGLALSFMAFFRSLGNPLEQDTKNDLFRLAPASAWSKLFASLLGGTVNCALDTLPALLLGALLSGGSLLTALAWLCFVISVDYYATNAGAFINLSVPLSAGKTLKQIVQILFLDFGLLPDILLIALGTILRFPGAAVLISALLNLALGTLFFALSPLFLDPKGGSDLPMDFNPNLDLRRARADHSRVGIAFFVILAVYVLLQFLLVFVFRLLWPGFQQVSWSMWLYSLAPLYLVAVPVGLLILRGVERSPLDPRPLGAGRFCIVFLICVCLMYAGNLVGILVNALLGAFLSLPAENPLEAIIEGTSLPLRILFMVVLAPLVEEFLFRRQIIDRLHRYGGKLAVLTSALFFGLFHGNLSQFFYAFALGLVFGCVYLKTGRLRYTVALHVIINFLGSVVAPAMLELSGVMSLDGLDVADPEALLSLLNPGFLLLGLYGFLMMAMAIAGLVLLCMRARKIRFEPEPCELPRGARFRTAWLNAGMILFVLASLFVFVLPYIQ